MRVVVDTNVFFSGLRSGGRPGSVLDLVGSGRFTLIVSAAILFELEDVLLRKLDWSSSRIDTALARITMMAELVQTQSAVTDCIDPDDNRILEAALDGRADCIVTGDKHLLRMKVFRGIEILAIDQFLLRFAGAGEEKRDA